MSPALFTSWNRRFPTFGNLAFASFLVAVLSGIPLSFSFDAGRAFDSLQMTILASPSGSFFRTVHYWSGQTFLFSTLLHLIEHLWKGSERDLKTGLWLRLVVAMVLSIFVMLTGFILKADAEGSMALQILSGLLETIPLAGADLKQVLVGNSGRLFIPYVHHLVTTTLFIGIIIFEHARRAWPKLLAFVYIMGGCTVMAVVFDPGFQRFGSASLRGPWYFIGFQELLHWIPQPLTAILIILAGLIALTLLRWLSAANARRTKISLLVMLLFYILLTVNNWGFRDASWNSVLF